MRQLLLNLKFGHLDGFQVCQESPHSHNHGQVELPREHIELEFVYEVNNLESRHMKGININHSHQCSAAASK